MEAIGPKVLIFVALQLMGVIWKLFNGEETEDVNGTNALVLMLPKQAILILYNGPEARDVLGRRILALLLQEKVI